MEYDYFYSFESAKEFDLLTRNKTIIQYINKYHESKTISFFIGRKKLVNNNGEIFDDENLVRKSIFLYFI